MGHKCAVHTWVDPAKAFHLFLNTLSVYPDICAHTDSNQYSQFHARLLQPLMLYSTTSIAIPAHGIAMTGNGLMITHCHLATNP
jgi:hypothetical protein